MQCFDGVLHGIYIPTNSMLPSSFLPFASYFSCSSVKPFVSTSSRRRLPSWPIWQIPLLRRRTLCSARRRRRCVSRLTRCLLRRVAILALLWRLSIGVRWRLLLLLWWWGGDVFIWVLRGH
jgi:hypothetical protein